MTDIRDAVRERYGSIAVNDGGCCGGGCGCGDGDNRGEAAGKVVDARFLADNAAWREERKRQLLAPDGWTSLVGVDQAPAPGDRRAATAGTGPLHRPQMPEGSAYGCRTERASAVLHCEQRAAVGAGHV